MGILGWILVALGIILGMLIVVLATGMLLPRAHVFSRSLNVRAVPEKLWSVISDFENVSTWHPKVISTERLPDRLGREVWRETYKDGSSLKLETMESLPPHRLVRSIVNDGGPFTGRWEFEITPTEEGCQLTITEKGEIPNPLFRFIFRLFMDPATTVERYLKSLSTRFEQATVAREGVDDLP